MNTEMKPIGWLFDALPFPLAGHSNDMQTQDISKLTIGYDLLTQMRMQRFEDRSPLVKFARTAAITLRWHFLDHYWGFPPKWKVTLRGLNARNRVLPDFACVGAIKSGTSDLANNLMAHPSVAIPLVKEIATDHVPSWPVFYPTRQHMERVATLTGAARTGYFTPLLTNTSLPAAYHQARPDAKIVLILRDPVERAYSHYKWDLLLGGPTFAARYSHVRSYRDYVTNAIESFPLTAPSAITLPFLQSGVYVKPVQLWLKHFGHENVHIVRAEDYFAHPAEILGGIYRFLGLADVEFRPHPRVNENPLQTPPEDEDARELLARFYRPWNRELETILGRDLNWT